MIIYKNKKDLNGESDVTVDDSKIALLAIEDKNDDIKENKDNESEWTTEKWLKIQECPPNHQHADGLVTQKWLKRNKWPIIQEEEGSDDSIEIFSKRSNEWTIENWEPIEKLPDNMQGILNSAPLLKVEWKKVDEWPIDKWTDSSEWTPGIWKQFNIKYPSFDTDKYNRDEYCDWCCKYKCDCDAAMITESCHTCFGSDRLHARRIELFNKLNAKNNMCIKSCYFSHASVRHSTFCIPEISSKFTQLGEGDYFECPLNHGLDMQFVVQITDKINKDEEKETCIIRYYFDMNGDLVSSRRWSPDVWSSFEMKYPEVFGMTINVNNLCKSCNCLKDSEGDKCIICND
jgi:hypothetical protein